MATDPSVKTAIYKLQTALLDGVTQEARLNAAANLLSKSDYADVVTERTIVNLCGYPLCNNKLPERQKKGRYRISLKEHRVYDVQETRLYCSPECLVRSRTYAERLEPERTVVVDQDRISEVLDAVRSLSLDDDDVDGEVKNVGEEPMEVVQDPGAANKTISAGKIQVKPRASEREKSPLVIHELENGHGEKLPIFDYAGPSEAIEGYVPRKDRRRVSPSDAERRTIGASSKLSVRPPSKKGAKKTKSSPKRGTLKSESDFTSTIIVGEPCARASSNCATSSSSLVEQLPNQRAQNFEGALDLPNDSKSEMPKLKSALKTRAQKQLNRSVTWADEKKFEQGNYLEVLENGNIDNSEETLTGIPPSVDSTSQSNMSVEDAESLESIRVEFSEESVNAARLESAEAFAMALTQAAAEAASGETDTSEAVSKAGMYILPSMNDKEYEESKHDADMIDSRRTTQIWPTIPSPIDEEAYDARDCWYDSPPEGFSLTLSSFATMYMAIDGWITAASVAHLYGRDESDEEEFLTVNGREYPRKVIIGGGLSAEIERTLASCISRALPGVVESLRLQTPISTLEQVLGRLLNSMCFTDAIPSFRMKQWHVIVVLFLDALSVHRIPSLGPQMMNKRPLIRKVLDAAGVTFEEYETMKELMIPLGRLPEFSAQSGG